MTNGAAITGRASGDLSGRTLLIRADGNSVRGAGHLVRCFALAEEWSAQGGVVRLLATDSSPTLLEPWRGSMDVVTKVSERVPPSDWTVIDAPHVPLDGALGPLDRTLVVDDGGIRTEYPAALVLNQNLHARAVFYGANPPEAMLLGPTYAMLRRSFLAHLTNPRDVRDVANRVLITFGGSDPGGFTEPVLHAFARSTDRSALEIDVLVGGGNPRVDAIREAAASMLGARVFVNAPDPGALMATCDVALSAAGSTVYELALLGTPMVLGAAVAGEEEPLETLSAAGAAVSIGALGNADPDSVVDMVCSVLKSRDQRMRLSEAAAGLVDGNGAKRVVSEIRRRLAGNVT